MASANVERIRHYHALLGSDQLSAVPLERVRALMEELFHPEIEWHDQRELPGATVHRGIDGAIEHFATSLEALDYEPFELRGVLDAGSRVVATYHMRARSHKRRGGRARRELRVQLSRRQSAARRDLRHRG
jgi:hypothetical protein